MTPNEFHRSDLPNAVDMSKPEQIPPPSRVWSDHEMQTMKRGLVPASMEDHWFAFFDDGELLQLYRSYTGFGVLRAQFACSDGAWAISEAWVEGDASRYSRRSGEFESTLLELLIDTLLLGQSQSPAKEALRALRDKSS